MTETTRTTQNLAALDHAHIWHPFTPMKQWREQTPLIIERGEAEYLIDTDGNRYIDGVSSLWCNVHGHCVPAIDKAVKDQLDKIAHTTLLGMASPPSIELAARLVQLTELHLGENSGDETAKRLNKVFYSDAGATALEVAFKMAVGYWYHHGRPEKKNFIGLSGAYHGDTVGAMSVGFSDLFHRPFESMVFQVHWTPTPDTVRLEQQIRDWGALPPAGDVLPSMDDQLVTATGQYCLEELEKLLQAHAEQTAAVVIEPIMQGAAGMISQPDGFVRGIAELARKYDTLLIADEVATGFGRTGRMFACAHDGVMPDILCLAKGLTGGYLPVAVTMCTDEIENAFCGELSEKKTLYHGHTYTGNALGCAASLASLGLFGTSPSGKPLLEHIGEMQRLMTEKLAGLYDCPHVLDIRQRGLMTGIELCQDRSRREPFDFAKRTGAAVCHAMREKGLIVRPLGDVVVLMPIPAMRLSVLESMMDVVVQTIRDWQVN